MNSQRISLVIPVYNEADRIHDCLQSIAAQTVKPFEVIVVDNNSTDGTAAIAASFPFVRVVSEKRQGVVYARDRGFSAARGDIIGRIDGDTLLHRGWCASVVEIFADQEIAGVSGIVHYRDVAFVRLVNRVDLFWRRRMARLLGRDVAMQGANMAVRRSAWRRVSKEVCHYAGMHEDFDLAVHMTRAGLLVRFDERLVASVSYRQAKYKFIDFWRYSMASPNTYLDHGVTSGRKMYQVVLFVAVLYPLISVISHGYDPRTGRFSLRKLFMPVDAARVNPATFVD